MRTPEEILPLFDLEQSQCIYEQAWAAISTAQAEALEEAEALVKDWWRELKADHDRIPTNMLFVLAEKIAAIRNLKAIEREEVSDG